MVVKIIERFFNTQSLVLNLFADKFNNNFPSKIKHYSQSQSADSKFSDQIYKSTQYSIRSTQISNNVPYFQSNVYGISINYTNNMRQYIIIYYATTG